MQVVWNDFCKSQHEVVEEVEESYFALFVRFQQNQTFYALKDNFKELKHFLAWAACLAVTVDSLKRREKNAETVSLDFDPSRLCGREEV